MKKFWRNPTLGGLGEIRRERPSALLKLLEILADEIGQPTKRRTVAKPALLDPICPAVCTMIGSRTTTSIGSRTSIGPAERLLRPPPRRGSDTTPRLKIVHRRSEFELGFLFYRSCSSS